MKRVFVIHGWSGSPDEPWLNWIKKELEVKGYEVNVPAMPNADNPEITSWVNFLREQIGNIDEETYFVGHSIGCQTIMRYLETIDGPVGGVVFVAGFFNLKEEGYEDPEEEKVIAKPWLETPINLDKLKVMLEGKLVTIFSDNDECVPLDDSETFKEKLGAKVIIEHAQGHFDPGSNITEVPSALNAILKLSS